jgi:hypothetical protein
LSTIPIAINEIINKFLRALVLMDKSISEVSTSTGVWGARLLSRSMEVRI